MLAYIVFVTKLSQLNRLAYDHGNSDDSLACSRILDAHMMRGGCMGNVTVPDSRAESRLDDRNSVTEELPLLKTQVVVLVELLAHGPEITGDETVRPRQQLQPMSSISTNNSSL